MSFRFLHAADLHLGSPLRGLEARHPELAALFSRASRRAFEQMIDLAIAERVAFVVIAGDVYDQDWTDYAAGQLFLRGVARLTREGIRTVVIRGNHDAEHVITRSLALPEGLSWLGSERPESVEFPEFGVAIHGMSFKTRAVTENMVPIYPSAAPGRFNIGLLHTSLDGRPDHSGYAPATLADLAGRGYDYWALGHVHAREIISRLDPTVVYAGNIQGRHVRETGEKSVSLVTVADGRVTSIEEKPVDAARWALVEVDLTGVERADEVGPVVRRALEDAASAAGSRPLAIRLVLKGETDLHPYLAVDRARLIADTEVTAATVADTIAIEQIRTLTALPRRGPRIDREDFDEAIAAALADPALRTAIAEDLAGLRAKLPAAVQERLDAEDIDVLLSAARALLEGRIADPA